MWIEISVGQKYLKMFYNKKKKKNCGLRQYQTFKRKYQSSEYIVKIWFVRKLIYWKFFCNSKNLEKNRENLANSNAAWGLFAGSLFLLFFILFFFTYVLYKGLQWTNRFLSVESVEAFPPNLTNENLFYVVYTKCLKSVVNFILFKT